MKTEELVEKMFPKEAEEALKKLPEGAIKVLASMPPSYVIAICGSVETIDQFHQAYLKNEVKQ